MPAQHHHLHADGQVDSRSGSLQTDSVCPVRVHHGVHLHLGADHTGEASAHHPSYWLEARAWTLVPGCGCHLDYGMLHLAALLLLHLRGGLELPQHQSSDKSLQCSLCVHGTLAIGGEPVSVHDVDAGVPVLPASDTHQRLLLAHFSAPQSAQGCYREDTGRASTQRETLQAHQRHASLHRGPVRTLLAAAERVQHHFRLEPRGPYVVPRCCLFRVPPHGDGVDVRQPHHLRLSQQQLPEGAEVAAVSVPVLGGSAELRDLPVVYRQHRHDQRLRSQQWL